MVLNSKLSENLAYESKNIISSPNVSLKDLEAVLGRGVYVSNEIYS